MSQVVLFFFYFFRFLYQEKGLRMLFWTLILVALVPGLQSQEFSNPCQPNPCGVNTHCEVNLLLGQTS